MKTKPEDTLLKKSHTLLKFPFVPVDEWLKEIKSGSLTEDREPPKVVFAKENEYVS